MSSQVIFFPWWYLNLLQKIVWIYCKLFLFASNKRFKLRAQWIELKLCPRKVQRSKNYFSASIRKARAVIFQKILLFQTAFPIFRKVQQESFESRRKPYNSIPRRRRKSLLKSGNISVSERPAARVGKSACSCCTRKSRHTAHPRVRRLIYSRTWPSSSAGALSDHYSQFSMYVHPFGRRLEKKLRLYM